MSNPTVSELVTAGLKAGGFDGLLSDDGECACLTEEGIPCEAAPPTCMGGYKLLCIAESDCLFCKREDCDGWEDREDIELWTIMLEKPKDRQKGNNPEQREIKRLQKFERKFQNLTNRLHEYIAICRKSQKPVSPLLVAETLALTLENVDLWAESCGWSEDE